MEGRSFQRPPALIITTKNNAARWHLLSRKHLKWESEEEERGDVTPAPDAVEHMLSQHL